ncbi:hypothetical protein ACH5RR_029016 [Cinchona calisaya]|uniref:Retrotransposon gag domain-containing protein n=1 Tax=Cinchona calisaya TaxID=153742 RepID=A0ABD2YQF9_9GENT
MEPMIDIAENDITWEEFREMFLDQYFPRALRKKRQDDFYGLRQTGNMIVLQYANKFTSLGRFCPKVFEDEEEKMDRFEQDYSSSSNLIKHTPSEYLFNGPPAGAVAQILLEALAVAFQEQSKYVTQFPTQFRKLNEQLRYVRSFVADVSQLKDKREVVKTALASLQQLVYEADDLIVDCQIREDYRKMKGSSSFPLSLSEMSFPYETGKKLTEITAKLKECVKS